MRFGHIGTFERLLAKTESSNGETEECSALLLRSTQGWNARTSTAMGAHGRKLLFMALT